VIGRWEAKSEKHRKQCLLIWPLWPRFPPNRAKGTFVDNGLFLKVTSEIEMHIRSQAQDVRLRATQPQVGLCPTRSGNDEPFPKNIHPHTKFQFRHSTKPNHERNKSFLRRFLLFLIFFSFVFILIFILFFFFTFFFFVFLIFFLVIIIIFFFFPWPARGIEPTTFISFAIFTLSLTRPIQSNRFFDLFTLFTAGILCLRRA
jgi:hypothetical protein